MAISAPKNPRTRGAISGQFNDLLRIHLASLDRQERQAKEDREAFWEKINTGIAIGSNIKKYRDAFLADKMIDHAKFGDENVRMYQKGNIDRSWFPSGIKEGIKKGYKELKDGSIRGATKTVAENIKLGKVMGSLKDFIFLKVEI